MHGNVSVRQVCGGLLVAIAITTVGRSKNRIATVRTCMPTPAADAVSLLVGTNDASVAGVPEREEKGALSLSHCHDFKTQGAS